MLMLVHVIIYNVLFIACKYRQRMSGSAASLKRPAVRLLQESSQVLVHQKLHVPSDEALCAGNGCTLQLPLPVCHLQVACLPAQTGEDSLPLF